MTLSSTTGPAAPSRRGELREGTATPYGTAARVSRAHKEKSGLQFGERDAWDPGIFDTPSLGRFLARQAFYRHAGRQVKPALDCHFAAAHASAQRLPHARLQSCSGVAPENNS